MQMSHSSIFILICLAESAYPDREYQLLNKKKFTCHSGCETPLIEMTVNGASTMPNSNASIVAGLWAG
jgi:hypothetical protein